MSAPMSRSSLNPARELALIGWLWRIIRRERDHHGAIAALVHEIETVIEELAEERHPCVERRGQAEVWLDVRNVLDRFVIGGAEQAGVAGDATEIFDETRSFDYYLGGTFAALGIVLLLTTIFQVRFGLAPLKRISESIADIRSGRAERLGPLPCSKELLPMRLVGA